LSRGLAAANVTASEAAHVRPILFVELQFGAGTEYLHNAVGPYTWGSHTWAGIGDLGAVSPIEEGDDFSPFAVRLTLSGINSSLLTTAQGVQIFERRVIIYLGFIGDDGLLVADPDEIWSGAMQTMAISLGGGLDTITLTAESELIAHRSANGAMFTDEDQQKRYAGDKFFEFLAQMQDARIQWGPNATGGGSDVGRGSAVGRVTRPRPNPREGRRS
jgi:hypothetical protein